MVTSDTFRADGDTQLVEVAVVNYPQVQLSASHGLADVFRVANEQLDLVNAPGSRFRVSHWAWSQDGVYCTLDSHEGLAHAPSYVVFPPSLVPPDRMAPTPRLRQWALELRDAGATLCALCAGVFILAETGLLDNRRATTHWAFAEEFAHRFPSVRLDIGQMVVEEPDLITAGGIMAWVDFGLSIVESVAGPRAMLQTSRFMLADAPRQHQLPYQGFSPVLHHHDRVVLQTQERIDSELESAPTLEQLAQTATTHPRTLQRRFKAATGLTISDYIQQLRLERARHALATTDASVENIARSVGYVDAATLRRLIKRDTGLTPAGYRAKFRSRSLLQARDTAGRD